MKKLTRSLAFAAIICVLSCFTAPVLAQTATVDVDDPDEIGTDEILNAQLWEYMKGASYASAKAYISAVKARNGGIAHQPAEVTLPSGWKASPAGAQVDVGRLPGAAAAFNGSLVVLNNGYYSNGVEDPVATVIGPNGSVTGSIKFPSLFPSETVGIDGVLYVSGGLSKQVFAVDSHFKLGRKYDIGGFVSGVTPLDAMHLAVLSLVTAGTGQEYTSGLFGKGTLSILNTDTGKIERSVTVGYFPYAVTSAAGKLYVTLLGEDRVVVIDPASLKTLRMIDVGRKPQNLCLGSNNRLYVCNTGSDSLSVIDTSQDIAISRIDLGRGHTHTGAAPISVAYDGAGGRLFVALANANAVAVVDEDRAVRIGEIPTAWYPTAALIDGAKLVYLSGKGIRPRRPNPGGAYVLTLLNGTVGSVPLSDVSRRLHEWTETVAKSSPVALQVRGDLPKVKHIFYIVRENRTYDQVLGDLGRGNGDAHLTLFGQKITPNGHRLAEQFVTLDNYYADGEISVLGHSFTTSGYASPFLEWLGNAAYSGRYPGYPFGMVPSATSPFYLWDALDAKGADYKIYGENYYLYTRAYDILKRTVGADSEVARKFYAKMMTLSSAVDRGNAFYKFAAPYAAHAGTTVESSHLLEDKMFVTEFSKFLCGDDSLAALIQKRYAVKRQFAAYLTHYPFNYRSWDLAVSDLERIKVWKADFERLVKAGTVPALEYLWLPNDHTGGIKPGLPKPDELVAQNDAALGLLVETLSHSSIWKDSLVLVTEDDAQAGPDHVDATRTVALAAGPGVRRNAVVSDRYDQISLIRTIGMLLGLKPLSQNDALAAPMFSIFTNHDDLSNYTAVASDKLIPADAERFHNLQSAESTVH